MRDSAGALRWIVEILTTHRVPFQTVGGLAARAYGATRELVDLDFYIEMDRFPAIEPEVAPHLVRPPRHHSDDSWDITFAQLVYKGQKIELGGVENAQFYDRGSQRWIPQRINFDRSRWMEIFGVSLPVMPREDLVSYKRMLDREVDRLDLAEIDLGQ